MQKGRKHCGKRRNCSLRAISPFPIVFPKRLLSQGRQKETLCGNGLKQLMTFEKVKRKRQMLLTNILSFFNIVFQPFRTKNYYGIHMRHLLLVVCKCFQFGIIYYFVLYPVPNNPDFQ